MIGFVAGVGQMSAIFGLPTCYNEPVRVGLRWCGRTERLLLGLQACELFQYLPG